MCLPPIHLVCYNSDVGDNATERSKGAGHISSERTAHKLSDRTSDGKEPGEYWTAAGLPSPTLVLGKMSPLSQVLLILLISYKLPS